MESKQNLYLYSGYLSKQKFLSLSIVILILGVSIYILQNSMGCVDSSGCFKDHCQLGMFNPNYQTLIRKSHAANLLCRAHPNIK